MNGARIRQWTVDTLRPAATPLRPAVLRIGVGLFAAIFAARYMLTTDPARWSHPAIPAMGVAVNAAVAGALWGLGLWVSRATGWTPRWGALPPVLLALAGTGLSVQLWSARRDAAVNGMLDDAGRLTRDDDEGPRP